MWDNELVAVHSGGRQRSTKSGQLQGGGGAGDPAQPTLTASTRPWDCPQHQLPSPSPPDSGAIWEQTWEGSPASDPLCRGLPALVGWQSTLWRRGGPIVIYSVCQFPRYKYSQQGQFQAPDVMSLTAEWRRGSCPLIYSRFTLCL